MNLILTAASIALPGVCTRAAVGSGVDPNQSRLNLVVKGLCGQAMTGVLNQVQLETWNFL